MTPSQISQRTGIAVTTLRDNIQRLVDRGLIRRTPNPDDGRSYLVEVTEKGEVLARAADPALLAAYEVLERRLQRPRVDYEQVLDELRVAMAATLGELDRPGGAGPARDKRAGRGRS